MLEAEVLLDEGSFSGDSVPPFLISMSNLQIFFCVRNTRMINANTRPAVNNGNVTSTQPVPSRMTAVFTKTKNMRASVAPAETPTANIAAMIISTKEANPIRTRCHFPSFQSRERRWAGWYLVYAPAPLTEAH